VAGAEHLWNIFEWGHEIKKVGDHCCRRCFSQLLASGLREKTGKHKKNNCECVQYNCKSAIHVFLFIKKSRWRKGSLLQKI